MPDAGSCAPHCDVCNANSRGVHFPVLLSVVLRVCQDVGDNTEEVIQQHTYLKQPDATGCSCKCRVSSRSSLNAVRTSRLDATELRGSTLQWARTG